MDDDLTESLGRLDAAARHVLEALRRLARRDPRAAVVMSQEVNDRLDVIGKGVADERALAVESIWRTEELSIAETGREVRVSKPRAQQLIDRGKLVRRSREDEDVRADEAGRGAVGGGC